MRGTASARGLVWLVTFAAGLLLWAGQAAALPAGFQETTVFSGLTQPTVVRFASDGRVFVAEKSGIVKIFHGLSDTTPTTFADLRTTVHNFWDRGLLGLALDPDFPADPYVYVLYTHDAAIGGTAPRWGTVGGTSDGCPTPPGATGDGCVVSGRLSRLTASGDAAVAENILIEDWCQQYPSHSVGALDFGADGALYVSGGDGASFNFTDYGQDGSPLNPCGDPPGGVGASLSPPTAAGGALRSQDLRTSGDPVTLDGSILRVDPDTGAALPSNPLASSGDPNARRIVAHGLRNPFRFTIRPGTSEVWVGDVGWNSWEEINRIPNPTASVRNFGWPCYEGAGRQGGYDGANLNICESLYGEAGAVTAAYFPYDNSDKVVESDTCPAGSASIAGLAFYEGGNYPAEYDDALFFTDYSRECIWVLFAGADGLPDPATRVMFDQMDVGAVDLEIGPGGDLFYVDFDTHTIRRITFFTANQPPTAVAQATPTSGPAPLTVDFDGTGSSDPDAGDTLTYAWDLDGDGQFDDSAAARPSFTYAAGNYTVRLRVTDPDAASDADTVTISSGNTQPDATILSPAATTRWAVGDVISFSGSASDAQQGALPASSLSWSLVMHHCFDETNCHAHPLQSFAGQAGGSFTAPDHEYPSHLELRLTATDAGGLTDTESVRLDPRTVVLTFESAPVGLSLTVGSASSTAPFSRTVIVGSSNTVSAPSPQTEGGNTYAFSSWSDGGAPTHTIVAPGSATTYRATFTDAPPPPSGLVAAYSFDVGSGATVADTTGRGHAGMISGALWSTAGKYGGALSFDGVNDWVTIADADDLDLTSAVTLAAWVRPAALGNRWRTVVFKEGSPLAYSLYAHDRVSAPVGEIRTGSLVTARGIGPLPLNAWSHLAATYDGAALRLYVNGALARTTVASGNMPVTAGVLRLGGNNIWNEWFSGLIDEVRIYDRALSQTELEAAMATPLETGPAEPPGAPTGLTAAGSVATVHLNWTAPGGGGPVARYNVHRSTTAGFTPSAANRIAQPTGTHWDDGPLAPGTFYYLVTAEGAAGNPGPPSNQASAQVTGDTTDPTVAVTAPAAGSTVSGTVLVTAAASDDVGVAGVQFTLDGQPLGVEDTTGPYSVSWNTTSATAGLHELSAQARDAAGNTGDAAIVNVTVDNTAPPLPNALVAAYAFDEGSGAVAADATGKGHAGSISGATWSSAGRFGGALSFDGVDDWVTVADANDLDLTTGMTLSVWVRPAALGTRWRTVIFKEGSPLAYSLYAHERGAGPISEIWAGGLRAVRRPGPLPLNAWSHVAATYDGAALRLYVDGAPAGSTAVAGSMAVTSGVLRIGGNNVWNEWFSGLIDEVRIYDRALSQAEIQEDLADSIVP